MAFEAVRAFFETAEGGMYRDRITVHESNSDTVEHAAQVCHCTAGQIAKTMSFQTSGGTILIVTSGDQKIQGAKFKAVFHEKPTMIAWDQVEERTGHAPGGVCPFALREGVRVYLDESLKRFPDIYIAGGAENVTIHLSLDELEKLACAEAWIDACKDV